MPSETEDPRPAWSATAQMALGAGPWVVVALAQLVVYAVVHHRLPEQVVSHVGSSGPDGFMAPLALVAITVGVFLAEALLFGYLLVRRRQTVGQYRLVAGLGWGVAAGEGYLLIGSFAANAGLSDPRDLHFPMSLHLPIAIGLCAVVGAVGVALARKADRR